LIFIDTGAFLARYLEDDQHQSQAETLWRRIEYEKEGFCTSNFVIDELATLLGRRSNSKFAARKVRSIYESELIDIFRPDEADEYDALVLFEKYHDQNVSFTDCVSFALMKRRDIHRVFSFDRHFDLPGFTRIPLIS
jgi:predicted nucleic acid-binding protein